MKKQTYRMMMAAVLIGTMTVCGTVQAATNSWNVGSGTWDTSTSSWKAPTTWTDGDSALFTNRTDAVTVTVSGSRSANLIRLGMSQINSAYYTFVGGAGSVTATNFVVQFQTDSGDPKTILTNLAMTLSGKLAVGRGWLVLAGTSAVSADRFVSSGDFGGDGTWGNLWLKDTASLSLPNGFVPSYNALRLDGGTLSTSYITMPDWGPGTFGNCVLNGGRIVALTGAQNSNFFQNNAGNPPAKPYGPYVSTRGVVFDSDANSITVKLPFKHDTNGTATDGGLVKLGSGTLTFSGVTNTYNGMTIVSNGTLAVSNMGALSAGDVTVANGATLSLNSARAGGAISDSKKVYVNGSSTVSIATGVNEAVYEFYLDGVVQKPGVWGCVGGSAANQSARLTGDGTLTVTHSPAPFCWNVGSGTWDIATSNWLWNGATSLWGGYGNDAYFTNRSDAVTVTVDGNQTAGMIRVGNGSNNLAKYTFVGGPGVSITATKFVAQFLNDGADKVIMLTNLSMTLSGKLAVGRTWLILAGNTAVTADKFVTSDDAEFYVAGPDLGAWGNLWLKDTATLRLTNGIAVTRPNIFKLDGGMLYASYLKISDLGSEGNSSILNGTRIVALPSAQNSDFIQFSFGNTVYVSTSGAVFDSDTNNITVKALLKHYSAGAATDGGLVKYGTGTLTLSATNTYNGATAISNGTLSVNGSLTNANITVAAGATLTGSGTIRCRVSSASNNRITVLGTATLSGLTLVLDVQGVLSENTYVLATGLGAAMFKDITNVPQQTGYSVKKVYRDGELVLLVAKKGTMIRFL
jgi:autotransporter-associated beta strand protein